MIWTVSDLMILLLTAALVINAAGGAALFLCRKLEHVASMGELSGILKGIILYTAFGLPVMVGVAIFKFTFTGRFYVISEDLEHGWGMRMCRLASTRPGGCGFCSGCCAWSGCRGFCGSGRGS